MRISDWSSDVCSSDLNLFLPATALSLALAACSQPAETDKTATASTDGEVAPEDKAAKRPPAIKPMDVPTRGGDGSPIELAALTEADVSGAKLKGELACSFADDARSVERRVGK